MTEIVSDTPIGMTLAQDRSVLMWEGEHYTRTSDLETAVLRGEIRALQDSHDRILAAVNDIVTQVGPTLEALKESPILKMLGVK